MRLTFAEYIHVYEELIDLWRVVHSYAAFASVQYSSSVAFSKNRHVIFLGDLKCLICAWMCQSDVFMFLSM